MGGPIGNGIVVKREPDSWDEMKKLLEHVTTESEFCTTLLDKTELNNLARGDRQFEWEEYQLAYFDIVGSFITNKPRQSGLSFACSAKYFATAQMSGRNFTAVFVSYKKEEAINKINYVKQIMMALPPTFSKRIIRDPLQMIEWENPGNKTRSKIYSHAQKPIRGLTADKILFDEFAFFTMAETIYESAFPALAQTNGTMDIISTPFGLGGMFYDILNDDRRFGNFEKWHIKWWDCMGYVKDTSPQAWAQIKEFLNSEEGEQMPTEEKVYRFGNHRLVGQFEASHSIESFRQEFEGEFLDTEVAYFPKELIFENMFDREMDLIREYAPTEEDEYFDMEGNRITAEQALADLNFGISAKMKDLGIRRIHYTELFDLMNAVQNGIVSKNLFAGYDVGVSKDNSCLVIIEEIVFKDGSTFQVERYREYMDKWNLQKQQDYLWRLMSSGLIRKLLIDKNGIGWQLTENLEASFPATMVEGVIMGGSSKVKERYITNIKSRLTSNELAILYSKDTIEHLYAIKREVRSTGGVVYTADENRRHHADYAIALSLACLAGTQAGEKPVSIFTTPKEGSAKNGAIQVVGANSQQLKNEIQRTKNSGFLKTYLTGDRAERPAKGVLKKIANSPIKPF